MSLVVVVGATGLQGGGIVDALIKDPKWKVRGVTRNPGSENAKALAAKGVEVVAADADEEDSLVKAFEGAYAVFALTNFWDSAFSRSLTSAGEAEEEQLKNLSRAASKTPTLKHYIVSSLPPADQISKGKHTVIHFDYKQKAMDWVDQNLPELSGKTTLIWPGWYGNNVIKFPMAGFIPFPGGQSYAFGMPAKRDSLLPVVGEISSSTGLAVEAILNAGEKTFGKIVPVITEFIPVEQVARIFTRATGKGCAYGEWSDEDARSVWGDVFGAEMVSQLRWSEDHGDWTTFFPEKTLTLEQLGVDKSKLINLEAYFRSVADKLVVKA